MQRFRVIVVGGGHAGVEAAWAAANRLGCPDSVALLTLRADALGAMSCNPAIGGLAKGQLVREIDALGGLMGLAADATGIQFKVLNTSKGPAVHGPRCQSDKQKYPQAVQSLLASRPEIRVIEGSVEELLVADGAIAGVRARTTDGRHLTLESDAVVLTTGTFMRGLMHTGETKTPGGRHGEAAAVGISDSLRALGFELGRLKTGTPPRLDRTTIDWESLPEQWGDAEPVPFSDLSSGGWGVPGLACDRFPVIEQIACRQTQTHQSAHEHIRANLHRAPMFSGQIHSIGPRYCPSIEDKVVRFAERESHGVFLEPEGLDTEWVYCNGIATSLPRDVQDEIVRTMPGCEKATILRYGYAVEYDTVLPHQIDATGHTRRVRGLFFAGQINGTSGYEEAAAQGLIAGLNAALLTEGEARLVLGRDEAYLGVLMDDLVTKTPTEPYRMFTSRAEHRLLLRADNTPDRLTPIAERLGLLGTTELGRARAALFRERSAELARGRAFMQRTRHAQKSLWDCCREAAFGPVELAAALHAAGESPSAPVVRTLHAEARYEPYVERERAEIRRRSDTETRRLPVWLDYASMVDLRTEARQALGRYRPETLGQASRLEGITPSDVTLLRVLVERAGRERAAAEGASL
ncbi:tRNA uridine-5-carboxymethylaminomethyl(34) synthesis enzyme MnmG [Nodularia spumigena]|uniref:tRNA uridine-5-carboxymethylaminomethyl(34) synthesis enzyme MnmG n=1 Tax=Nodularia spumigena TaxID=70799 RepID=UPI002B21CE0C|nr:tRNA uridine-5-carboxymethylaminomethyl(34) synthesis enzyme MnmG [Nodularia spumigena]MEA5612270.1 tRNA uridine-5-carboxymethylaminomethyl(34) synthesis enzyme MnmG [Nodularia spumigena UHCC 0040]